MLFETLLILTGFLFAEQKQLITLLFALLVQFANANDLCGKLLTQYLFGLLSLLQLHTQFLKPTLQSGNLTSVPLPLNSKFVDLFLSLLQVLLQLHNLMLINTILSLEIKHFLRLGIGITKQLCTVECPHDGVMPIRNH